MTRTRMQAPSTSPTAEPGALLIDYGGVLTRSLAESHASWCAAEGVVAADLDGLMRRWAAAPTPPGNPVHLVETGALPPARFERLLAGELRDRHGAAVPASGLLARMFAHFTPEPALVEAVRGVRRRGYRTVLVTNSWGSARPWEAMPEVFDAVVVSCDLGVRKPDAEIYLAAARAAGTAPGRCLFIDDNRGNVAAAAALGMRTLLHVDAASTLATLARLFPATGSTSASEGRQRAQGPELKGDTR